MHNWIVNVGEEIVRLSSNEYKKRKFYIYESGINYKNKFLKQFIDITEYINFFT